VDSAGEGPKDILTEDGGYRAMILAHVEISEDITDGSAIGGARSRCTRKMFKLKAVWITLLLRVNATLCLPVAGWHTHVLKAA